MAQKRTQYHVPARLAPAVVQKTPPVPIGMVTRCMLVITIAVAVVAGIASAAQDHPPKRPDGWQITLPEGSVDWTAGTARAQGQNEPTGKIMTETERRQALDQAITIARRRLFNTVMSLPVANGQSVSRTVTQTPAMMVKLKDTIDAAEVTDTVYLSDGTVRVTVETSLREGLAQLLLPPDIKPIERIRSTAAPEKTPPDDPCAPDRTGDTPSAPHTGLIIDARHTDALPAIAFAIHDETGRKVYGAAFVSRELAVQHGMGQYWLDMISAKSSRRVCPRPMIIRALRMTGSGKSDFVISSADAGRLISAPEHVGFLRECRVAIILPPPPKPPSRKQSNP